MVVKTIIAILESMTKEPKLHLHDVVGYSNVTFHVRYHQRYHHVVELPFFLLFGLVVNKLSVQNGT